jgi:hypothetical protein
VLSGRGLCDGPIPRPEESYRLRCVSECDQVKINNLDTCCEQVEEGRTAKRNELGSFFLHAKYFSLDEHMQRDGRRYGNYEKTGRPSALVN